MEGLKPNSYIVGRDLYYPGVLRDVKKSDEPLRPLFEAFINSLEAVRDKPTSSLGEIEIRIQRIKNLIGESFHSIEIRDNGVGFDDENFARFLTFKDTRKGRGNKGSGRIQLVHFFDNVVFESTFKNGDGWATRSFSMSREFVQRKNALVKYLGLRSAVDAFESETTIRLSGIVDKHQADYELLSALELKEKLVSHFWLYLALNKDSLPKISLRTYIDETVAEDESISISDIPSIDKDEVVEVPYSRRTQDTMGIETLEETETFHLRCFKMSKHRLQRNGIKVTSKNEIIENAKVNLTSLGQEDDVENNRYLFLLSGEYLDSLESDTRGEVELPTRSSFMELGPLLREKKEVLIDDLQARTNEKILTVYSEIRRKVEEKQANIDALKQDFFLDPAAIEKAHINLSDSEEKILNKVYSVESEMVARSDAKIKRGLDRIRDLDSTSDSYHEQLGDMAREVVETVPNANRLALTHYIARRRIVLELFDLVLEKELDIQKAAERSIDEKLLHNLIFQQSSSTPDSSDLWLINEDFIYFAGNSEIELGKVQIDGVKIFKDTLTNEEEEYRRSLGEDRYRKRPDILLFPQEGKCIIIEFKDPKVNLSDHLHQLNKYAGFIRNFTKDEFPFETFYGFLIGDSFNRRDVRAADPDFKEAYHFDYMFRPSKAVAGEPPRTDGSIYTEIISYRTLLERASRRNQIFLEKLGYEYVPSSKRK